ncbi:uncharacterized protein LOC126316740 isoform X2 [Schistocerca gregaria]|uniref:uncharacterized protein LOC126316740 isoform X2 n=1 Tax=Schistocerca gregaria TaxID=7010 RepID=UPI00211DFFA2|nr:uncharacterized protein LOC126316740 isoform X2 [Schistocerca gregaria]
MIPFPAHQFKCNNFRVHKNTRTRGLVGRRSVHADRSKRNGSSSSAQTFLNTRPTVQPETIKTTQQWTFRKSQDQRRYGSGRNLNKQPSNSKTLKKVQSLMHLARKLSTTNRLLAASLLAALGVISTTNQNVGYSRKTLECLYSESLDNADIQEIYTALMHIADVSVRNRFTKKHMIQTPIYIKLCQLLYHSDPLVRLLSLRAITGLAEHNAFVLKYFTQTQNFDKLDQLFLPETTTHIQRMIETSRTNDLHVRTIYERSVDKDLHALAVPYLDELLVLAFDRFVSVLAQNENTHSQLLQSPNLTHYVQLINSPDPGVCRTGISFVSGLTKSVEGRKWLAEKTDVFPHLCDLTFGSRSHMYSGDSRIIRQGKFALQQLLLSESAMRFLRAKYETFLLNQLPMYAKKELLVEFDIKEQEYVDYAKEVGRVLMSGYGTGFAWGALRSAFRLTPSVEPGSLRVMRSSTKHVIARGLNTATGTVLILMMYHAFKLVDEKILCHERDTYRKYYAQLALTTGTGTGLLFVLTRSFRYTLTPAILVAGAQSAWQMTKSRNAT